MLYPITTYYKILDQEEKKGKLRNNAKNGINVSYGECVLNKSRELKEKRKELRIFKKSAIVPHKDEKISRKSVAFQQKLEELKLDIEQIKEELIELKRSEIDEIAKEIESGKTMIILQKSKARDNDVYSYGNLSTLLACKIVMYELRKQYHVYPSDRNEIIDALRVHLQSKINFSIIRLDIKHFFESIPQKTLLDKLYDDGKMSPKVMRYIKRTLYEYNKLTNNSECTGLPRGICFSSYLAEIYLKSFDQAVKYMDGVLFYRRYVDDIIVLTIYPAYPHEIVKVIEEKVNLLGLELHRDKKLLVKKIYEGCERNSFDYLGYKFNVSYGSTTVGLSDKKFYKYNLLLHKIFEIYDKTKKCYSKKKSPLKEFLSRIAVLTSNGNLNGRKNYVKTGIYYSNKMLTDKSDLEKLDSTFQLLLKDRATFSIPSVLFDKNKDYELQMEEVVKKILSKNGFLDGFNDRRSYCHSNFTTVQEDLKHIYLKYKDL